MATAVEYAASHQPPPTSAPSYKRNCHPEQSEGPAFAFVFAVAFVVAFVFLSVIPEGNLLF
jgi:hypothetical protein